MEERTDDSTGPGVAMYVEGGAGGRRRVESGRIQRVENSMSHN
jgi:hypothetical protein